MTHRVKLFLTVVSVILTASLFCFADDEAQPTTRRSKEGDIALLEQYLAKTYAAPLSSKPRLPKLIALMSLSKIDSLPSTLALIEAAGNKDLIVSYLAWEILHARQTSLPKANYDYWVERGLELVASNELPGTTVKPMLDAAVSIPQSQVKAISTKAFDLIMLKYSPKEDNDLPVLKSAGRLLATWNEPALIQHVAEQLSDSRRWPAAEFLLMALPNGPQADAPVSKGSALDEKRRGELTKFAAAAGQNASGPTVRPYTGIGKLVPAPQRITDPNDEQWHKDLELGKLAISNFDLAWVMDSTGSMNATNQTVAAETAKVMRVISLVSDQSRVGAVYFRHETLPKLELKCCKSAALHPWYQTKYLALNKEAGALAAAMAAEKIPKPDPAIHNMHSGSAVHGGLFTAISKLKWSVEPNSIHVIVLIFDSNLTKGTEAATKDLVITAAKQGFYVHGVTTAPQGTASGHEAIIAGGGVHFELAGSAKGNVGKSVEGIIPIKNFAVIPHTLIKSSINKQYRDRIDPLLDAFELYVGQAAKVGR